MDSRTRVSSPSNPSRRTLLTAAAAGVAVAAGCAALTGKKSVPVPVAPQKGPLPDGAVLKLGIIGTGGMGGAHMNRLIDFALENRERLEIVALSDVCTTRLDARLAQAREKAPDVACEGYTDYRELLARDAVDAVVIASPEHWHATMAVDAMVAGKDVYLEKPMTLRLDEALFLHRFMLANPHMRCQVGTQYVMGQKYAHAKRLIAEGAIGHPTFSQTSYCRNSVDGEWLYDIDDKVVPGETIDWDAWLGDLGPREWDTEIYHRWRRYRDFSTGIVGDLLVHQMTPLAWALDAGWPTRVTAAGGHYVDKAMENHDQVNLTVEWEREHTMVVAGSTCNERGLETMIRGHRANLFLGSLHCVMRPERIYVDEIDEVEEKCEGHNDHDLLRLDWLRSVRTREANASPVELGAKIMVAVDLATRSIWEGRAYRFDPETLTASAV
jgi:predicted dehydrogenase